jgi:hypothetical protein
MTRYAFLLTLLVLSYAPLAAQKKTEDFEMTVPGNKVSNSLYNNVRYMDSRLDTSFMGVVQLGAFNRKARVVPKTGFGKQVENVLNGLTDSSAKEGTLLFQLRQFNFAELTGQFSEKGYCYLRASVYAQANDHYRLVAMVDTVVLIKAMDVTRALFRNGSKVITDFISSSLVQPPNDSMVYSYNDVLHIDSIEKRKVRLYNSNVFTNGVYNTFTSFFNQQPDITQFKTTEEKGSISAAKVADENGKFKKIKSKDIYAVVQNGNAYIATEYGYYPLTKEGDDFHFTGKAKVNAKAGDVIMASMFFGILGGLLASDAEATFEMKLDHINGGFIRLREIPQAVTPSSTY